MGLFFWSWFLGLGLVTLHSDPVQAVTSGLYPENPNLFQKCRTSRVHSMLQTSCSGMELREIPTNLKSSIQVLDLTKNRIRYLYNKTFENYPNIGYLYLADNILINIEAGTFEALYYLEALDLSTNGISKLPKSLLHMAYLRKLYLAENAITDSAFDGTMTAPITHIDLSSNELTRIPDLGPTADLRHLNVSRNKIARIYVDDIAPLCSLKVLDLRNNSAIYWDPESCECQAFVLWVNQHKIDAKYDFKCPNLARCREIVFANETLETWSNCTQIIETKELAKRARSTWILVASCLATFCVFVFIGLCCIHKRNKKRRLRLKEEQKLAANAMQNAELLHNQHNT